MENLIPALVLLAFLLIGMYYMIQSTGDAFFWPANYRKGWKMWRKEIKVPQDLKFPAGTTKFTERCECKFPTDSEVFVYTIDKPFLLRPRSKVKGYGTLTGGNQLVLEMVVSYSVGVALALILILGLSTSIGFALHMQSWRPLGIFGGIAILGFIMLFINRFFLRYEWELTFLEMKEAFSDSENAESQTL